MVRRVDNLANHAASWVVVWAILAVSTALFGCSPEEKAQVQTVAAQLAQTAAAEGMKLAKTQAAQLKETAKAELATQVAKARTELAERKPTEEKGRQTVRVSLAQVLDEYLRQKKSPLAGLGSVFVENGQRYNVDPRLIVAIAGAETTFGNRLGCWDSSGHVVAQPYNAWNWFYKGGCPSPFGSWSEGIERVTRGIGGPLYLQGGRTSIEKIAEIYTATERKAWIHNVTTFYKELGGDLSDLSFKMADLG